MQWWSDWLLGIVRRGLSSDYNEAAANQVLCRRRSDDATAPNRTTRAARIEPPATVSVSCISHTYTAQTP